MKNFMEEAKDHWEWVWGLLDAMVPIMKFLYVTSMAHGYKHGFNDAIDEVDEVELR